MEMVQQMQEMRSLERKLRGMLERTDNQGSHLTCRQGGVPCEKDSNVSSGLENLEKFKEIYKISQCNSLIAKFF